MVSLVAQRVRRAPRLFWEGDRVTGNGHVWRKRHVRVLVKLGLIVVCTLVILVVVLVVRVTSGGLST
jgi:lipopolysaccharide/colanic/teichoic acid biosynthesis glycosyltransferase